VKESARDEIPYGRIVYMGLGQLLFTLARELVISGVA